MNIKMIGGIVLILGIVSIALLATPIQAYANGTGISDFLKTQERERSRTHEQDGDMLQTQNQERLRTQDCNGNCNGAGTQTQYRNREMVNEDANNVCNCVKNMEQHRYQYREGQEA